MKRATEVAPWTVEVPSTEEGSEADESVAKTVDSSEELYSECAAKTMNQEVGKLATAHVAAVMMDTAEGEQNQLGHEQWQGRHGDDRAEFSGAAARHSTKEPARRSPCQRGDLDEQDNMVSEDLKEMDKQMKAPDFVRPRGDVAARTVSP